MSPVYSSLGGLAESRDRARRYDIVRNEVEVSASVLIAPRYNYVLLGNYGRN